MNIKKIAITATMASAILMSAIPAFASHRSGHSDVAVVGNSSTAVASTGSNTQNNSAYGRWSDVRDRGDRTMTTGNADADSTAVVIANTHIGCGCESRRGSDVAMVGNESAAIADSGLNEQDNTAKWGGDVTVRSGGSRTMTTGNANADSDAWVVVNTHVSGWSWGM